MDHPCDEGVPVMDPYVILSVFVKTHYTVLLYREVDDVILRLFLQPIRPFLGLLPEVGHRIGIFIQEFIDIA